MSLWNILLRPGAAAAAPASQPSTVRLVREHDLEWTDRARVARSVGRLRRLGFKTLGSYRVEELPDFRLVALGHPEDGFGAVLYEHAERGVYCDLVARYEDGNSLLVSNSALGGTLTPPPWDERIHLKKARIGKLYQVLLRHLAVKPMVAVRPGNFQRLFEESYARETEWRQKGSPEAGGDAAPAIERDPELDRAAAPLFESIAAYDAVGLQELLRSGAPTEGRNVRGETALVAAVATGDATLVRLLLEAGAAVDVRAPGNPSLPGLGYPEFSPAGATEAEVTPLTTAIEIGDAEIVRLLVAAGAPLAGDGGLVPLHFAAQQGDREMARVLLEAGADADGRGELDWTPLMSAAYEGAVEVAEIFLEAGADVDVRVDKQWAILLAADEGHPSMVELLACHARKRDVAKAEKILAQREKEIEGAIEERDMMARRLIQAAANGRRPMVQKLLEARVDPDALEYEDREYGETVTALMMAIQGGHLEVVRTLLGAGADVNFDSDGQRPIDRALGERFPDDPSLRPRLLRMLIDSGARIDHLDEDQRRDVQEAVQAAF